MFSFTFQVEPMSFGTKLEVLITYFIKIRMSNSFSLLTIIKETKLRPLISVFSIESNFLPKEIR